MFGPAVNAAAQAHAIREYPKECCGVVTDGAYLPLINVAEDPLETFQLPADAPVSYQAIIHSHCAPRHGREPSAGDLKGQAETAVPWGIVLTDGKVASKPLWFGEFRLDEPLLGREHIHGVTDCYSLIESWWWQNHKDRLPVFPRDREWWNKGGDLYRDGFPKAGFRETKVEEGGPGDIVLMQVRSKVPNHSGVVLENGLLLHHLQNRLSRQEPLNNWRKFITHWLRRNP